MTAEEYQDISPQASMRLLGPSSDSSNDRSRNVFQVAHEKVKTMPQVANIHSSLVHHRLSLDLSSNNHNQLIQPRGVQLQSSRKTFSNFTPIQLPRIDVSKHPEDFGVSSLRTLKKEWVNTTVDPNIKKSQVIVRKKEYSLFCLEKEAAIRAARERYKRKRYIGLWQKAFKRITMERRRARQKIYGYWRNAAEQLMRMHFEKKDNQNKDSFEVLCGEFERLMNVEDWKQIRKKEFDLDKVMKTIENRHRQKVMDQFRHVLREEEKTALLDALKKTAKIKTAEQRFVGIKRPKKVVSEKKAVPADSQEQPNGSTMQQ